MKKFLFALVIVSLCVRACVFISLMQKGDNCWIYPDSVQYHTTAQQLAAGKGFTTSDGQPQMYRLPGYPLFLAAGSVLLGDAIQRVLWLQVILAVLIPVLMFFLALAFFPGNLLLAKIASVTAALHVGFSIYASMVATETLFLVFLLLFFMLFFHKNYALAGFCLGIASLIRPVGHYGVVLAGIMLLLSTRRVRPAYTLVGAWFLVVAPWLVRNFLLTGALFFHTLPGHHFLQYSAAYVLMERDQCSYGDVRPVLLAQWEQNIYAKEQALQRSLNDYERCKIAETLAWGVIKQHPWYFVKTALTQVTKTCFSLYTAQPLLSDSGVWPKYTQHTGLGTKIKRFLFPAVQHKVLIPLIYLEMFMFFLLLLGLLFFMVGMMHEARLLRVALHVLPFVLLFIALTLGYGCARLRMPAEPFLIIFAVAGWLWVFRQLHERGVL